MGCGAHNNNISSSKNIQLNITESLNSEIFIDKLFPPENSNIFGKENLEKILEGKNIKNNNNFIELIKDFNKNNIIWKRSKEIFNGQEFALLSSKISNNDIIQGEIGDCYFLTIISSLTKYPSIIYQLFNNLHISENGNYEIKFKINNKISILSLDDYFPYNLKTNMPLFCKPYKNSIWVMLLEKAWAKIKGSYLNIDNGSPYDVFESILISSSIKKDIIYKSYYINNDNKHNIWENIIYKVQNNKNIIMICLSKDKINTKKKINNLFYTIIEKHYYNIIDIFENNEKEKVLKLRNPWGFNLKNDNYHKNKKEIDFIIDDDNESNKYNEEDENLLSGGEFLIDYNYFCYLFKEIQIYEINNFSLSIFLTQRKEKFLNIIYLNIKKSQNKELNVSIIIDNENMKKDSKSIDNIKENNYISLLFVVIDLKNSLIINRINQKIYLINEGNNFSIPINPEVCEEYYLCFFFSLNNTTKDINNIKYHIKFENKDYFDLLGNINSVKNKDIYELIKDEFCKYDFDLNFVKYNEKNEDDIFKDIDDIYLNEKYLLEKYPKEMKFLMDLKPMSENIEKIIFRDKYYYKNNNYYLGEQLYNGNIRHGRGIYYMNKNGNMYLGYNKYGQFFGKGKIIYKNGDIKDGEFINGKFVIN